MDKTIILLKDENTEYIYSYKDKRNPKNNSSCRMFNCYVYLKNKLLIKKLFRQSMKYSKFYIDSEWIFDQNCFYINIQNRDLFKYYIGFKWHPLTHSISDIINPVYDVKYKDLFNNHFHRLTNHKTCTICQYGRIPYNIEFKDVILFINKIYKPLPRNKSLVFEIINEKVNKYLSIIILDYVNEHLI